MPSANAVKGGCTLKGALVEGTSCMRFIALVVGSFLTVEFVEGHLEGRWRAAAPRDADRVICQMWKAMNLLHPLSYLHI